MGIDISVHFTFLLLILFLLLTNHLDFTFLVLLVFGCVLLHELGHALMARQFGVQTRGIVLLPIGGLAQLERIPTNPWEELAIALAGPAVNVVLGIAFLATAIWIHGVGGLFSPEVGENPLLVQLMGVNVTLFIFNLIPAFPMDGGRVLRALLALKLDYVRATRLAARTGQWLAILFGLGVLFFPQTLNPILILIAVFVYLAAGAETSVVERRHRLQGKKVSEAMVTSFERLRPETYLWRAVEHLLGGEQADFPIERDGELLGILTREDLIEGLARRGESFTVQDTPFHSVEPLDAGDALEDAHDSLERQGVSSLPVVSRGELVGLLSRETLLRYALVRNAIEEHEQRS